MLENINFKITTIDIVSRYWTLEKRFDMIWKDSVINQKFCFKNLKKKKEFQNVQIQILIRYEHKLEIILQDFDD